MLFKTRRAGLPSLADLNSNSDALALGAAGISIVRDAFRGIFSRITMLAKYIRCGVLRVYGFSRKLISTSPHLAKQTIAPKTSP
jgi:hypothetical protein